MTASTSLGSTVLRKIDENLKSFARLLIFETNDDVETRPKDGANQTEKLTGRRLARLVRDLFFSFVVCNSEKEANEAIKNGYSSIWRTDETDEGFRYLLSKDRSLVIFLDFFGLRERVNELLIENAVINYKSVRPYSKEQVAVTYQLVRPVLATRRSNVKSL